MLKMILKDLRLSPLRSILTSVSMLVGIIGNKHPVPVPGKKV